jgi:two-component system response regulator DevR
MNVRLGLSGLMAGLVFAYRRRHSVSAWLKGSRPISETYPLSRSGGGKVQRLPSPDEMIRVFIVCDQRFFTEAVMAALNREPRIKVAGFAAGVEETVAKALPSPADVVLVDAALEHDNPVHLVRQLKQKIGNASIVVLGVDESEPDILAFIEAGASGYVSRQSCLASLLSTVKSVYMRESPCSPRIAASVFAKITALSRARYEPENVGQPVLTLREKQILRLVAGGLTHQEIALRLSLTTGAVRNQVQNILSKLQVHQGSEAWHACSATGDKRLGPIVMGSDSAGRFAAS